MNANAIKLKHGASSFYIQCYDFETIGEIKSILCKKYKFDIEKELEILQNNVKLDSNFIIKDIQNKENLQIIGSLISQIPKKTKEEDAPLLPQTNLTIFREMRFNEPDEIIKKLLEKNNFQIEPVITALLLNKIKAKKNKP